MRKLLLVLVLSSSGLMAQAVVQTCTGGTYASNPTATCVMGSNVTSGHIVVFYEYTAPGLTPVAPTGCSPVASWTLAKYDATSNQSIYTGSVTSTAACTITGGGTGGTNNLVVGAYELSGTANTVDGTPGMSYLSYCGSCVSPSVTTTYNGDILVSFALGNGNFTTTPISPFSPADFNLVISGPGDIFMGTHDVQVSAGTISASWSSAGTQYHSAIIAMKAATVVPTVISISGITVGPAFGNVYSIGGMYINPQAGYVSKISTLATPITALTENGLIDFHGGTSGNAPTTTDLGNSTYLSGASQSWSTAEAGAGLTYSNVTTFGALPRPIGVGGSVYDANGSISLLCTSSTANIASIYCGDELLLTTSTTSMSMGFTYQSNCNQGISVDCGAQLRIDAANSDYITVHFNPGAGALGCAVTYVGILEENHGGNATAPPNTVACLPYVNNATYRVDLQINEGESAFTATFSTSTPVISATQTLAANQAVEFTNSGGALPTGIAANTPYFVIPAGLSGSGFEIATAQNGSAIQVSTTGTGTQTGTVYNIMTVCELSGSSYALIGSQVAPAFTTGGVANSLNFGVAGEGPQANGYTFYYGGVVLDLTGKISTTVCF